MWEHESCLGRAHTLDLCMARGNAVLPACSRGLKSHIQCPPMCIPQTNP